MIRRLSAFLATFLMASAAIAAALPQNNTLSLNVHNWVDYIAPMTNSDFTAATGIAVNYTTYEASEELDAQLAKGAQYDIAVSTASPFFSKQVQAGYFRPLDKSKIPNFAKLDKALLQLVANADPGNQYGVIYAWGTDGIGYNVEAIRQRLPGAPTDSWNLVFKPEIAKNFADCGISFLDSGAEIIPLVLKYLGLNPNSQKTEDLQLARDHLMKLKPYIKQFNSSRYIQDLAEGRICLAIGFSGDILQAAQLARNAKKPYNIDYTLPKEGTMLWFDMMGIPTSVKSLDGAYQYINYVLQPEVAAKFSNYRRYANAVTDSYQLIDKDVLQDPDVFLPPDVKAKLFTAKAYSPRYQNALQDVWQQLTAGQQK